MSVLFYAGATILFIIGLILVINPRQEYVLDDYRYEKSLISKDSEIRDFLMDYNDVKRRDIPQAIELLQAIRHDSDCALLKEGVNDSVPCDCLRTINFQLSNISTKQTEKGNMCPSMLEMQRCELPKPQEEYDEFKYILDEGHVDKNWVNFKRTNRPGQCINSCRNYNKTQNDLTKKCQGVIWNPNTLCSGCVSGNCFYKNNPYDFSDKQEILRAWKNEFSYPI